MTKSPVREEAPPLRTVVFAMSVPEDAIARMRGDFPGIRFVLPGEAAGADGQYRFAPSLPNASDLREADGFIGWTIDAETLAAAPRLRWIHSGGAGVEHLDLAGIAARGIILTNSRGVHAANIAEHVLGMMLALTRRIPRLVLAQQRREWRDHDTHLEVGELQGQTLLIVGLGEIGRAVAQRAGAFGMRVRAVRRRPGESAPDIEGVSDASGLLAALNDADHVVVTLPSTPETRGLFDEAAFAAMKPGAMIYNVGRGPVIDTAALVVALQSGQVRGAGLDVTDPEPLPADSPLWAMENVLITAHTAGATPHYWERQSDLIAENIRRLQLGEPPRNLVDVEAGY